MAKSIAKLPLDDRPYEKLELLGASNLTNSELLAIVIKTGTSKYNCVEIAQNILTVPSNKENEDDLEHLVNLSIEEQKEVLLKVLAYLKDPSYSIQQFLKTAAEEEGEYEDLGECEQCGDFVYKYTLICE